MSAQVKPAAPEKESKSKKEKVAKTQFIKTPEAKSVLNKDGLISSVSGIKWDRKVHKGLRKTDFADQAVYMEWQASQLDLRAASITAQATKLRKEAELARTVGTPEQRKKVAKLLKMKEAQAALRAELAKDGVDLSGLDSLEEAAE